MSKLCDLAKGNTSTHVIGLKLGRPDDAVRGKTGEKEISLKPPGPLLPMVLTLAEGSLLGSSLVAQGGAPGRRPLWYERGSTRPPASTSISREPTQTHAFARRSRSRAARGAHLSRRRGLADLRY